jgi:uncharacterized RDD family membrane protein YckC
MQWNDDVRIETPEQIDLQLEIAGLGSRFVAQLIDWFVKWGLLFVIGVAALVAAALLGAVTPGQTPSVLVLTLLIALFYAFQLGFDIFFELRHNGQTPGKKFAGIRVMRERGGPVDFQASCVRNLLAMADFLPLLYLFGGVLVLVTSRGQRLGDLAAGTIVVRERAVGPPSELEEEVKRLARDEFAFTPEQLSACRPEDRHLLRSFFQRYGELEAGPRDVLARRLADTFLSKTGYQPPRRIQREEDVDAFLATLYRDLEEWARHGRA